ncbi:MAG TPA: hypothetical protein PKY31_07770 [Spirochaetota bacterium]|nr:hypothetical protein [Spirochaetota bacterium]
MMKKIIPSLLLVLGLAPALYAQYDDMLPARIGVKVGSPNVLGLAGEYAFPLGPVQLGIDADFSWFPIRRYFNLMLPESFEDTTIDVLYGALGLRLYLYSDAADGPSLAAFVGRYQVRVGREYHYEGQTAEGAFKTGVTVFTAVAGWRWIWGNFYLGVDAGYGIAKLDDTVDIELEYSSGARRTEEVDIGDVMPVAHGIVASVEAGVAF